MQKLTQPEAQDLIKKAWEMVSEHTLGSYRFGQTFWHMLPKQVWDVENSQDMLLHEQDSDTAIAKFYKWFVEDSNN